MPTRDGVAVSKTVEEIRYRIVSGLLNPGEAVRQEDLAQELHLSRAPIREAFRVVADQGLLEHRVHTGYFVKKRSTSELRQIYIMLEFLESHLMATIEAPDAAAFDRMRSINDQMRELVESDDWSPMIDLNRRFHFEIFRLSPLLVVLEELERLWTIAAPVHRAEVRHGGDAAKDGQRTRPSGREPATVGSRTNRRIAGGAPHATLPRRLSRYRWRRPRRRSADRRRCPTDARQSPSARHPTTGTRHAIRGIRLST